MSTQQVTNMFLSRHNDILLVARCDTNSQIVTLANAPKQDSPEPICCRYEQVMCVSSENYSTMPHLPDAAH